MYNETCLYCYVLSAYNVIYIIVPPLNIVNFISAENLLHEVENTILAILTNEQ